MATEVDAWLESLGLGEHAEAFAENGVTRDLLPDLTNDDLKDLGVARLADRKALLKAIAALDEPAPAPRQEAERRQITVMFCDLVGSTALAEALDPEELRGVMQAYQSAAGGIIERYGGHVAQYLGDGLMTYFGWPQAHEDDAERAVRASLEIVEAINAMDLQVRIGIATGPVVVGETGAGDASVPKLAVGETPNLAARVQGMAGPDDIVAADSTRRLLGAVFTLDDLGEHALKGIVEPVRAWRVADFALAEGRLSAVHGSHLTTFVGREAELALLAEKWEQAKAGEGQLVLLSGEPGIGKSRLAQAIREHAIADGAMASFYQCSPYHTNTAFHPISDFVARDAGFSSDDPAAIKLERIDAHVRRMGLIVEEVAPLIAAALSVPTGQRYPALDMSPQLQKERTVEALANALLMSSAQAPLLFLVEDMHWADPSSLETAGRAVERLRDKPILALFTFRPEFAAPWSHLDYATPLALGRMGRARVRELVARVTGGKALPDTVEAEIVAKTDGVPLFVEELTKTVLESGIVEERDGAWALSGPLTSLAIPSTLRDSLMARLDRLGPSKEVAQIGACLGREFPHALLSAISPLDDAALQESLAQLIAAELIFSTGASSDTSYTFKHALIQDVAYESLLKSRRQQLHAKLAEVLLEMPRVAETMPELLAHHYTKAEMPQQAVQFWFAAGRVATGRSANVEAISHLEQGLALLVGLPESPERDRQELALQVAAGSAFIMAKGYAAEETATAYERAQALCRQFDNAPELLQVHYGLFAYRWVKGELVEARDAAEDFLHVAQTQKDRGAEVVAERTVGAVLAASAEFGLARQHLERTLALYERETHSSLAFEYAQDPAIAATAYLSTTLWMLGFPEQARDKIGATDRYARELAHSWTLVNLLTCGTAWLHMFLRNPPAAGACAAEALSIATEQEFPYWAAYARIISGWATAYQNEPRAGVAVIKEGIRQFRATGSGLFLPMFFWALADAHRLAGETEDGLAAIGDGVEAGQGSGELWWHAELHCLRGVILMQCGQESFEEAETAFRVAIEIAQSQEAKAWELRAATSLARLWQSQGRSAEARDLLAPVYGWFTEGFDSADLTDARTLLDALES